MTDAPAAPAIFEALVRIQSELGNIAKTGRGPATQGGYPFMPVDTIVARLNPLLSEHGVVVIGNQQDAEQTTYRFPKVTPDGTPVHDGRADAFQIITRLRYEVTFISSVDGSSVTAAAYGESADTGDKGLRRAATAAYKEVLLRVFTITSGDDDPENHDVNDQPAQVVRKSRGQQQRERAQTGTQRQERAPRAARDDEAAEPEEQPAAGGTNNQDPDADQQGDEEAAAAAAPAPTAAERRAAASAARKKPAPKAEEPAPAAEEPKAEPEFQVDPADVAHAEATAPAPRTPAAPVDKPEPETKADEAYESVADVRKAIRDALAERKLDRDYANTLGDQVTGKQRGAWFANKSDLVKVLNAIRAGEVADDNEGGF